MGAQEPDDEGGKDHDVEHEEAGNGGARGELATEEQEGEPFAADRDRQRDRVGDAQARSRQQVVEQRVPEEAVGDGEQEEGDTDDPVDLTRPPERPREEDATQVDDDGADEHERGPVVDLTHHQAGAHVEAEVEARPVGRRHGLTAQRRVHPVVDDLACARLEEEREVDTGQHEHRERVHGDLADHERPVIGKDLVERGPGELRRAESVVDPTGDLRGRQLHPRFQ